MKLVSPADFDSNKRKGMVIRMRKKRVIIYGIIVVVTVLLNVAAWSSAAFSDWYIAWIFPVWVNTYGRLTGVFPFSVGEWLIAAGLILTALMVLASLLLGISCVFHIKRKKVFLQYMRFYAWVLLIVCLIMTLNCTILYHASTFSEHYFGEDNGEYTPIELMTIYNRVVEKCNELSEQVERDNTGAAVMNAEGGHLKEMNACAVKAMQNLGRSYSQLDGWYPNPKAMFFSDFMCQQSMQGYYFPFSMEANYNAVMQETHFPSTMCHELAHLRGYIYEDEANLIGYLACVESEDIFFQYSGYLSVLNYLGNDLYKIKKNSPKVYEETLEKIQPIAVKEQVRTDNIFVTDEEWDRINDKAVIETEVVDKAADAFVETNLKINGVSDGKVSYSRVVRLLMQYYRCKGEL